MEAPRLVCDKDIAPFDIWAEMWDEPQPVFSANNVREFLDLHADAPEIIFEIRSDGGSTSEARIIYDMIKNSGKKVITEGYKCNSSAMILFLSGEERLVSENSDNIIHPVWVDAWSLPFALEAEDLKAFAKEIEEEQVKLLDIYVSVIGEGNRSEVEQMMADTTNLTSDEAIRLGFATGKLEGVNATNSKRVVVLTNKIAQVITQNRIKNNSKNQINPKEMSLLTDTLNSIKETLAELKPKNEVETPTLASIELADESALHFEGELAEGASLFTDEALANAIGDGDHELKDGRTLTVAEGKVTGIADAATPDADEVPDNDETLANRVEAMETANAANAEALTALATSVENMVKVLETNNKTLETVKKIVPGDGERKPVNTPAKKYEEMTNREKMEYNRANR